MRFAVLGVGLLLAGLSIGCGAGDSPANRSTTEAPLTRSEADALLRPPVQSRTGEDSDDRPDDAGADVGPVAERESAISPASSDSDGILTTVSYHAIANQISVAVELYDDSELNRRILEHMDRALRRAEHTITVLPQYELSFSAHFHAPFYFQKEPDLGEVSFGKSMKPKKLELNIWSSTRDSLLTGRRPRSGQIGRDDFEIRASLRDRRLGRVVWEGRAIAYVERARAEYAVPNMVDALIANLGRSVHGERFPLQ